MDQLTERTIKSFINGAGKANVLKVLIDGAQDDKNQLFAIRLEDALLTLKQN